MIDIQQIWNTTNLLIGGIIGFISSLGTARWMYQKKEHREMQQRVYEPLRQELEDIQFQVQKAGLDFPTEQWERVHSKECWSFRIRPVRLLRNIEKVYNEIHNQIRNARNAREKIIEIIKKYLKLKEISENDKRTIFTSIANDLVVFESDLNLYQVGNSFDRLRKKYKLKHKNYDDFKKDIIPHLKKDKYLEFFWKKMWKFSASIDFVLQQLKKKLDIKEPPMEIIGKKNLFARLRDNPLLVKEFYSNAMAGLFSGLIVGIFFSLFTNIIFEGWVPLSGYGWVKHIVYTVFIIFLWLFFSRLGRILVSFVNHKEHRFHMNFVTGLFSSVSATLMVIYHEHMRLLILIAAGIVVVFFLLLYCFLRHTNKHP